MTHLISSGAQYALGVGAVVEYLPGRKGNRIEWCKIAEIDRVNRQVRLGFVIGGNEGWYDPADIGACFTVRPHGQTKKQAQDEANKAADARENSLAGGRCSSTGLSGDARRMMEDLAARGLTPTGRRPPQPEMQDFPARDMHGARAGVPSFHDPVFTKAAQLGGTEAKLYHALSLSGCRIHPISDEEFDAILAGLALLRVAIPNGLKFNYDSVAGQCWTNGGEHDGLGVEAVQALADRLNHGE